MSGKELSAGISESQHRSMLAGDGYYCKECRPRLVIEAPAPGAGAV